MAMLHLLKIRTSIDIFKNEKCKVTFGLEYTIFLARFVQTVQIQIRLLLEGLHCLPFLLYPLDALRERLRTHKVFQKDQCFYLNYHKFSIKSYVLDVY